MKRTIGTLVALALVIAILPLYACADNSSEEQFTLRNGIMFGDTMKEVKGKETLAIDTEYGDEYNLYTEDGTVAGISGTSIWYRFDESDGLLYEVRWTLPDRSSLNFSNDDYDKLYKAFTAKYGDALGYTNGNCYIITGSALEAASSMTFLNQEFIGYPSDIIDYDEWIVSIGNDEFVKIELVQFDGPNFDEHSSIDGTAYTIYVGYYHYTQEDLEAAKAEKQAADDEVMNDI